jgi:hypothetical protein
MVQSAAFIDFVVVDRLTPDFEVGTRRWAAMRAAPQGSHLHESADAWLADTQSAWRDEGARIHFRVLERLKGHSPNEFTLNGSKPYLSESRHFPARRAVRLEQLPSFLNYADLLDGPQMGDCTVAVVGEVGVKYLIFRDAAGFPLRTEVPVRFRGHLDWLAGPSVVPILSNADPWPQVVMRTLATGP